MPADYLQQFQPRQRHSAPLIADGAILTGDLARISHRSSNRWRRTLDSQCIVHALLILVVLVSVENVPWIQATSQS